jgi:hypothetical protein
MNEQDLLERIKLLEYHQRLILEMLPQANNPFYKLVIAGRMSEHKVADFFENCEKMSIEMEEQKAEGFVYFHPLFKEFMSLLPPYIRAEDMVTACLKEQLFIPLMTEFEKYV